MVVEGVGCAVVCDMGSVFVCVGVWWCGVYLCVGWLSKNTHLTRNKRDDASMIPFLELSVFVLVTELWWLGGVCTVVCGCVYCGV